jgi:hypothetical protein
MAIILADGCTDCLILTNSGKLKSPRISKFEVFRVTTVTFEYCLTDKRKITNKIRKSVYGGILVKCS